MNKNIDAIDKINLYMRNITLENINNIKNLKNKN